MLIDVLFATVLAVTGLLALSALTTDTLALNQETAAYIEAGNALADFTGRWQLQQTPLPGISVAHLCDGALEPWRADWCSNAASGAYRTLDDLRVCVWVSGGDREWRLAWDGADCLAGAQPQVRRPG